MRASVVFAGVLACLVVAACVGDDPVGGALGPSTDGGASSSSGSSTPGTDGSTPAQATELAVADASVVRGSQATLEVTLRNVDRPLVLRMQNAPTGVEPVVGELPIAAGTTTVSFLVRTTAEMLFGDVSLQLTLASADGTLSITKSATLQIRGVPGELDTSFGVQGAIQAPAGATLLGTYLDTDDSLYAKAQPADGADQLPMLVHYAASGARDVAFGGSGSWVAPLPTVPDAYAVDRTYVGTTGAPRLFRPGAERASIRREGDRIRVITATPLSPYSDRTAPAFALRSSLVTPAGVTSEAGESCFQAQSRSDQPMMGSAAVGDSYFSWPWRLAYAPDTPFYTGCGPALDTYPKELADPPPGQDARAVAASTDRIFLLRRVAEGDSKLFVVAADGALVAHLTLRTPGNTESVRVGMSRPDAAGSVLLSSGGSEPTARFTCLQRVSREGVIESLTGDTCLGFETRAGSYPLFGRDGAVKLVVFGAAPALYLQALGTTIPLVIRGDAGVAPAPGFDHADAVVDAHEDSRGRLVVVSGAEAWSVRRFFL